MDDIQDLFLNGVASAKGGNRRLAEAFFKRVVRKNPLHEAAWLWLAEVLDDPDDIAYCLDAALTINPQNEKARMALELVQGQGVEPSRPREWSSLGDLLDLDLPTMLEEAEEPPPPMVMDPSLSRTRQHSIGWTLIFAAAVLFAVAMAVAAAVYRPGNNPGEPTSRPLPTIDRSSLQQQELEHVQAYFQEIDPLMGPLRLAHDIYWGIYLGENSQPLSLAEQVAQTSALKAQIETTLEALHQITPPDILQGAHQEYVDGLVMEQEALDNSLRFFETAQLSYANRSTVKMQDAEVHLRRAKRVWTAFRDWSGMPEPTRLPTPTPLYTPTFGPTPSVTPTIPPPPTLTPTPIPTQPHG